MAYKWNVFTDNLDISSTVSGSTSVAEYPKYYIPSDTDITVGSYGQYAIHETDYLEVEGSIELEEGAMIIIEEGV